MSHWQKADDIARLAASLSQGHPDSRAMAMLSELAVILRDTCERVGLRQENGQPVEKLVQGQKYRLTLEVEVTVADVHDGHGLSYELELEQRDFFKGRTVAVDANEITSADER